MDKNIVLTGFMGSGKSVVAKRLSDFLNKELVCTDDIIEARENRTVVDIFRDSGEPYFRKIEKEVIKEVSSKENIVIDCGGGIVLDPENVQNLKRNGMVFFLSASAKIIYKRLKHKKDRPLLKVDDPMAKIQELLETRMPYYTKADHIIETDQKTVMQVINEIVKITSG